MSESPASYWCVNLIEKAIKPLEVATKFIGHYCQYVFNEKVAKATVSAALLGLGYILSIRVPELWKNSVYNYRMSNRSIEAISPWEARDHNLPLPEYQDTDNDGQYESIINGKIMTKKDLENRINQ